MRSTILLALTALTTACAHADAAEPYWPQWQGPTRDARSTDTGLLKTWPEQGPHLLWSVDGIGAGFSSPTMANGTLYISGMIEGEGFITAITMDGTVKWRKPYGREWHRNHPGARSSVTIANGRLYVLSGAGIAACLDTATGRKQWAVDIVNTYEGRHLQWGYGESLLVVSNKVICTTGSRSGSIAAFHVDDGSLAWTTAALTARASYSSPIAVKRGGRTLIIQLLYRSVVVVDAADGSVLCRFGLKPYQRTPKGIGVAENTNSPVYEDGHVFVTSGYDAGSIKLKLSEDGTQLTRVWENHDMDVHHGGFVLVDGYLYGTSWINNARGRWLCVDWTTGKTTYQHNWDGKKGSIAYADGMLYCYQERTGMLALVPATPRAFDIVSRFPITADKRSQHWAHPVICGGVLYMRYGDALMAYDVRKSPEGTRGDPEIEADRPVGP